MEKVGFGFFGRPIDHKYISNGLFKSSQLEGETYLNLPNNINLAKGERIVKVSRQAYGSNMLEIIKVYIFDYAESFNSRPGGFIGSAYVFMGNPTQKLLYNAVKHIHPKVLKLLDESGKFKDRDFDINVNELISPTENGLVIGKPQKISAQLNTKLFAVHTDGPVLSHLISVVQGFMYNPNFKSLESIYVSDNKDLLKRITRDDKKILGIGHLLNFQKYYQQSNKFLAQKREELQLLQKSIEEEKRKKGEEIESYLRKKQASLDATNQKISDKNQQLKSLNSTIADGQKRIESLKYNYSHSLGDFEDLKYQIETSRAQVTNLRTEINSLNSTKYNSFEKLLEDKRFQSEKKKYLTNNSEIGSLKSRISELEDEIRERDENKIPVKKKLGVVAGIILFFLILGYSTGALLPPRKVFNKITSIVTTTETSGTEETDETTVNSGDISTADSSKIIQNINPYNAISFMNLAEKEQLEHKEKLNEWLDHIESNITNKEDEALKQLFRRNWNFAEILDFNKKHIDTTRLERIRKIYNKFDESVDFIDKNLMIPGLLLDNYEEKEIDFKSDKRNEMLGIYLSEPKNIYKDLGIDSKGESYNYEENLPLLYAHFRWVVHKLSNHDGNHGDIKYTGRTIHVVPIKK